MATWPEYQKDEDEDFGLSELDPPPDAFADDDRLALFYGEEVA